MMDMNQEDSAEAPEAWYWGALRSACAALDWPLAWQIVAAWPCCEPPGEPLTCLNPPPYRADQIPEAEARAQAYLMGAALQADQVSAALRWHWVREHYKLQPVFSKQGRADLYDPIREGSEARVWSTSGMVMEVWAEFGAPVRALISLAPRLGYGLSLTLDSQESEHRFPAYRRVQSVTGSRALNARTALKLGNHLVHTGNILRELVLAVSRIRHQEPLEDGHSCDLIWAPEVWDRLLADGPERHPTLTFRMDSHNPAPLIRTLRRRASTILDQLGPGWEDEDDAAVPDLMKRPAPVVYPPEGTEP